VLGLLFIIVTVSAVVATKGFEYLRDTVIGNPSKELLKGDWVTSDYGVPPISMTTPDVLIRGELDLPEGMLENVANKETYSFGTLYQNIYVTLNKVRFKDS
ncbi:hypothetical protein J9332_39590, partial [Aquimarina celericrescens]|nr:hypothetical protein [Aquimarina celericrescens]